MRQLAMLPISQQISDGVTGTEPDLLRHVQIGEGGGS
jgi:hypothetical protein